MTSEITFVETYTCPRCLAELEPPPGCGAVWVLCPRCGRAAQPPEPSAPLPRPRPIADEGILFIGPDDQRPLEPLSFTRETRRPLSAWRIFLLLGFVIAFCGLAEAFFAQNTTRAAVFGLATLVFVGMMTYPTKPGRF